MHSNRRKVADRAEAQALLDDWERSGLGLAEFSRQRGLDGRSLHCWKLNLGRDPRPSTPAPSPALRLVELTLPRTRATYRIRIEDVELEVDDDFDDRTLDRLLRLVRGC